MALNEGTDGDKVDGNPNAATVVGLPNKDAGLENENIGELDGLKNDEELEASVAGVLDTDDARVDNVGVLAVVSGADNAENPCPGTAVELLLELENSAWDVDAVAWVGAVVKNDVDGAVDEAIVRVLPSTTKVLERCCVCSIHK